MRRILLHTRRRPLLLMKRCPKTTLWSSDIASLSTQSQSTSSSPPEPTSSRQASLPRLPVPELSDTLERYLRSLEPLYHSLAASGKSADVVRNEKRELAREFAKSGGVGERLQRRLRGSSTQWFPFFGVFFFFVIPIDFTSWYCRLRPSIA